MSEILHALEFQAQAQGTAHEVEPVVDMRSARLLPATAGPETEHLPLATVSATHLEIGDSNRPLMNATYTLDTDSDEALDVRGLLTQLLTFPRPADGIVPDTWGNDQRAEIKRVSTDMDSVYTYTLDRRVKSVLDGIRQDILELRRTAPANNVQSV